MNYVHPVYVASFALFYFVYSSYPYLLELLALDIHEQKRIPNMGEVRFGLQLAREVFV